MSARFICPATALAILVLAMHSRTSLAQTITPRSPELRQFLSPMILDYSLAEFFAAPNGVATRDLAAYSCRGVSILLMSLGIEKPPNTKNPANFRVVVNLNNNSGKDKRVTLTGELRSNETSLGTGSLRRFDVEQGDSGSRLVSFPITLPGPASEPLSYLRLTVAVLDY